MRSTVALKTVARRSEYKHIGKPLHTTNSSVQGNAPFKGISFADRDISCIHQGFSSVIILTGRSAVVRIFSRFERIPLMFSTPSSLPLAFPLLSNALVIHFFRTFAQFMKSTINGAVKSNREVHYYSCKRKINLA